jgi:hypothetical protein
VKLYNILFYISLILSSILALSGFSLAGIWQGDIAVIIIIPVWIFARRKIPDVCLIASTLIAAMGMLFHADPSMMLFYTGLTIACWDLTLMDLSLSGNSSDSKSYYYQSIRLKSLGIALGIGAALTLMSIFLKFKLPFFITVLLVIITYLCFSKTVQFLQKKQTAQNEK